MSRHGHFWSKHNVTVTSGPVSLIGVGFGVLHQEFLKTPDNIFRQKWQKVLTYCIQLCNINNIIKYHLFDLIYYIVSPKSLKLNRYRFRNPSKCHLLQSIILSFCDSQSPTVFLWVFPPQSPQVLCVSWWKNETPESIFRQKWQKVLTYCIQLCNINNIIKCHLFDLIYYIVSPKSLKLNRYRFRNPSKCHLLQSIILSFCDSQSPTVFLWVLPPQSPQVLCVSWWKNDS
jgi:dephospho-CoA kinase